MQQQSPHLSRSTNACSPSSSSVLSASSSCRGILLAAQAKIPDYSRSGVRTRTWWHLRHLQEPLLSMSEDGISVVQWVLQTGTPSSPGKSRRQRRKRKTPTLSSSVGTSEMVTVGSPCSYQLYRAQDDVPGDLVNLTLTPATQIYFVYESYRVVFCLHVTRSLFSFQGDVLPIDEMETALTSCLHALLVPLACKDAKPVVLYITIVACVTALDEAIPLVQGFPLNQDNVKDLVASIPGFLMQIENHFVAEQNRTSPPLHSFERALEAAIFGLHFLPAEAAPALVILTDGVFQQPGRVAVYDDLSMRLCRDDVSVSVVHVAHSGEPRTLLGYISDMDAVRAAFEGTGGSVLALSEVEAELDPSMVSTVLSDAQKVVGVRNLLQYSILVRHSRLCSGTHQASSSEVNHERGPGGGAGPLGVSRGVGGGGMYVDVTPVKSDTPTHGGGGAVAAEAAAPPRMREKLKIYTLPQVRLKALIEARAAEGFQMVAFRLGGVMMGQSSLVTGGGGGGSCGGGSGGGGSMGGGNGSNGSSRLVPRSRRISRISDSNVLLRLTRHFLQNVTVEYTLEYEPLMGGAGDMSGLGSVNVTIDVVGGDEWIRLIKDPSFRAGEEVRQALRKFLRAIQDVDLILFRVINLLKPTRQLMLQQQQQGGGRANKDDEGRFRELLWLGQVPVSNWKRWLRVEYLEVVASVDTEYHLPTTPADGWHHHHSHHHHGPATDEVHSQHDVFSGDEEAMDALVSVLADWSTHHAGRNLFWKLIPPEKLYDDIKTEPTAFMFCLVRLTWLSPYVACLCLGSFGGKLSLLHEQMDELREAIDRYEDEEGRVELTVPERNVGFQLVLNHRQHQQEQQQHGGAAGRAHNFHHHHVVKQHQHQEVPPQQPGAVLVLNDIPGTVGLRRSYLQKQRWKWQLGGHMSLPLMVNILTQSKLAAGFLLVQGSGGNGGGGGMEMILMKHTTLRCSPSSRGGDGGDGDDSHSMVQVLIQYRVCVEAQDGIISTELWMEPQWGFARPPGSEARRRRRREQGQEAEEVSLISHQDLWRRLTSQCYRQDRRLLAAISSFHYIRSLCATNSRKREAGGGQQDVTAAPPPALAPSPLSPGDIDIVELLVGAERIDIPLRHFSKVPLPSSGEGGKEDGKSDRDINTDLLHLTELSLKSLLNAEIPSRIATTTPPVGHQQQGDDNDDDDDDDAEGPSSKDLASLVKGGRCFAHRLASDVLSLWFFARTPGKRNGDAASSRATVPVDKEEKEQQAEEEEEEEEERGLSLSIFTTSSKKLLARFLGDRVGSRSSGDDDDEEGSDSDCGEGKKGFREALEPLVTHLNYLHRRNFTQMAYEALRSRYLVAVQDLRDALSFCSEIGMDLGLTQLRKIATATADRRVVDWGSEMSGGVVPGPLSFRDRSLSMEMRDFQSICDEEFNKSLSQFLSPVPGTDFYFFTGTEQDLLDMEADGSLVLGDFGMADDEPPPSTPGAAPASASSALAATELGGGSVAEPVPPKVYIRRLSDMASIMSSLQREVAMVVAEQEQQQQPMLSLSVTGSRTAAAEAGDGRTGASVATTASSGHGDGGGEQGEQGDGWPSLSPPFFVRFECVHSLAGHTDSQTFTLGPDNPPSAVLTRCLDDTVAQEDVWLPPRVSRQATALSIVCATHSRHDATSSYSSMEGAAALKRNLKDQSGALTSAEIKEMMISAQRRFLRLVRRQVEAWEAAETLRCLLSLTPFPEQAVPLLLHCLRRLHRDSISKFQVELSFVASLSSSRSGDNQLNSPSSPQHGPGSLATEAEERAAVKLFEEHLLSGRFLPTRKIGDIYVVVEAPPAKPALLSPVLLGSARAGGGHSFLSADGSQPLAIDPSPTSPASLKDLQQQFHSWPGASSTSSVPLFALDQPQQVQQQQKQPSDQHYRVQYWAVLQVRRKKVVVQPSSSASSSSSTVASLSAARQGGGATMVVIGEGGQLCSYEVKVALHHPPGSSWFDQRHTIAQTIRQGISDTCCHVNQVLLLQHLHESRVASPLLIAPSEDDLRYSEMEGGRGEGSSMHSHSHSGSNLSTSGARESPITARFGCPRKLSMTFPLYHRLTPQAALRALESSVLHPLTVNNRLHVFVHRDRHGKIFYLRLEAGRRKEAPLHILLPGTSFGETVNIGSPVLQGEGGGGAADPLDTSLTHQQPPPLTSISTTVEASLSSTGPLSSGGGVSSSSTTTTTTTSGGTGFVELSVYGVEEVGDEISVQLRRLLESRLAEFALTLLSELLSRNPLFQLNAADLDLIKTGAVNSISTGGGGAGGGGLSSRAGGDGGKHVRAVLELPRQLVIQDPYLFMLYLRQNVARAQFINNLHVQQQGGGAGQGGGGRGGGGGGVSSGRGGHHGHTPSYGSPGGARRHASSNAQQLFTMIRGSEMMDGASSLDNSAHGEYASLAGPSFSPQVMHPARLGYSSGMLSLLDPSCSFQAGASHPAFWRGANPEEGAEVDVDSTLFRFYYNHSRPEMYEIRKDVASTLSNRGARLAKEVGKGLALIQMQLLQVEEKKQVAGGGAIAAKQVTRLHSGMLPSRVELDAIAKAASTSVAISATTSGTQSTAAWALSVLTGGEGGTPLTEVPQADEDASPSSSPSSSSSVNLLSIEVMGSVNGQALIEWLKLCVDQTLHDYFVERLLAGVKYKLLLASGKSSIIRPLDDLLSSAMSLDNPSVRRHEISEVLAMREVPLVAQMLGRALYQVHTYFHPGSALFTRHPDGGLLELASGVNSLVTDDDGKEQQQPQQRRMPEVLALCGLKTGGPHHFIMPLAAHGLAKQLSSSSLPGRPDSPPPVRGLRSAGGSAGGGGKGGSHIAASSVAAAAAAALSLEAGGNLSPGDVLYPHLSTSEGATTEMVMLRATLREALAVVHLTPEGQNLVMYNCHPELYARCISAFQRVLAFAALQRFLMEGMGLHKLGLLPLDLPWWRHIPGLVSLIEAKGGIVGGPVRAGDGTSNRSSTTDAGGTASAEGGGGGGGGGGNMSTAGSSHPISRSGSGNTMVPGGGGGGQGGGGAVEVSRGAGGGAAGGGEIPTEAGPPPPPNRTQPPPPPLHKEQHPKLSSEEAEGGTSGTAAGMRKLSSSGHSSKSSDGPVMTPAMAARLRASGRAGPHAKRKVMAGPGAGLQPPSTSSMQGPPTSASTTNATSTASGDSTAIKPGAGNTGGSGNTTSSGKPSAAGGNVSQPSASSTPREPNDQPLLISKKQVHHQADAVTSLPSFEIALHGAIQWIGALQQQQGGLQAPVRRLSRTLVDLLPSLCCYAPPGDDDNDVDSSLHGIPGSFTFSPLGLMQLQHQTSSSSSLDSVAAAMGSPGSVGGRGAMGGPDPLWRRQALRLWYGPLEFFCMLAMRARVRSLVRPWLWRQTLLAAQHKAATFVARLHKPLDVGGAASLKATTASRAGVEGRQSPAEQPQQQQQQPSSSAAPSIVLSQQDLSAILKMCRWQSCWSIPILLPVTTLHLPVLVRALDFPLLSRSSLAHDLPPSKPPSPPPGGSGGGGKSSGTDVLPIDDSSSSSVGGRARGGSTITSPLEGSRSRSSSAALEPTPTPSIPTTAGGPPSHSSHSASSSRDYQQQQPPLMTTALRSGASIERSHVELASDLMSRYINYLVKSLKWTMIEVLGTGAGSYHPHHHSSLPMFYSQAHIGSAWPLKAYLQRPVPGADTLLILEVMCSRRHTLAAASCASHAPSSETFSMTVTLFSLDAPEPPPAATTLPLATTHTFRWWPPTTDGPSSSSSSRRGGPHGHHQRQQRYLLLPQEVSAFSSQVQLESHVYDVTLERTIDFLQAASGQPGSTTFLFNLLRALRRRYPEPPSGSSCALFILYPFETPEEVETISYEEDDGYNGDEGIRGTQEPEGVLEQSSSLLHTDAAAAFRALVSHSHELEFVLLKQEGSAVVGSGSTVDTHGQQELEQQSRALSPLPEELRTVGVLGRLPRGTDDILLNHLSANGQEEEEEEGRDRRTRGGDGGGAFNLVITQTTEEGKGGLEVWVLHKGRDEGTGPQEPVHVVLKEARATIHRLLTTLLSPVGVEKVM